MGTDGKGGRRVWSDRTYMITTLRKANPRLGGKVTKDGRQGFLFLDYYFGCTYEYDKAAGKVKARKRRRREALGLYEYINPKTTAERRHNRVVLAEAERARYAREMEIMQGRLTWEGARRRGADFHAYVAGYCRDYGKRSKGVLKCSVGRFMDYIRERWPQHAASLHASDITREMMAGFASYLQERSRGGGAATLWGKWKGLVNKACRDGVFSESPCSGISIARDTSAIGKEWLSAEEVSRLVGTRPAWLADGIRRAFILTLYTGIRFCDVSRLTYRNVDYSNKLLAFTQGKTEGASNASHVVNPLSDGLLEMIGEPPDGCKDARLFRLPSGRQCNLALARWVEAAGIHKHITWHSGRHSFAVNALRNADIYTVSRMLGHSTTKMTEKYLRATDEGKRRALQGLPRLNDGGGDGGDR